MSPTRGSPYVAYLLDTQVGDSQGGTGESFDWSIARRVSEGEEGLPVLVAGGLHKGNIEEALGAVGSGVLGVDVSSGVEVPGQGNTHTPIIERCLVGFGTSLLPSLPF